MDTRGYEGLERTPAADDGSGAVDADDPTGIAPGPGVPGAGRRRAAVGWIAGVLAVAVLVAAVAIVQVSANRAFDAAQGVLRSAVGRAVDTAAALEAAVGEAEAAVLSAERIVASAGDTLADPAASDSLASAAVRAAAAARAATAAAAPGVDERVPGKPFWLWELVGGASALAERERAASALESAMTDAAGALDDARTTMDDAATALYASVPAAAAALEAANVSATSVVVLDFRDAAAASAEQSQIDSDAADAFATYALQAVALTRSAESELAGKQGPLYATRLEIEAYARSIAGGVVLDFDWAPTAAGVGGPSGMGGTATWQAARGGYSTITLSNSVAENWPSADAQALVTHEVGHSITSKCYRLFDNQQQAANEEWATAWAIGMGHTAEGNGVQAYGYPSQGMIDVAATCR